jgi:hypothetical protein
MKMLSKFLAVIVLFFAFALCCLAGSWKDVPLEAVIKAKPLVVVGEIQRIETAPKSDYAYDTAFIKIERILKSTATNRVEKVGAEIGLATPSPNNKTQTSRSIRYRKGQRGVWILDYRDGKYWATYPKDFQEISEEPRIVTIIKEQGQR